MASVLRKFEPFASSTPKDDDHDDTDDGCTIDYSIALEYHGPSIANIPLAVPLDIDQIPMALTFSSSSPLDHISFPVIQPFVRKPSKDSEFGSELDVLAGSVTGSNVLLKDHDGVRRPSYSSSPPSSSSSPSSSPSSIMVGISSSASGEEGNRKLSHQTKASSGSRPSYHLHEIQSSNTYDEGEGFHGDRDSADMESIGSGSYSSVLPSGDSHGKEDIAKTVNLYYAKRASVTFFDPPLSTGADEESAFSEYDEFAITPKAERRGKKGSCYRCLSGSRFTEKEICIVCSAKYCSNCVLRAMGSMPEGRKCVTCIGKRIDESRRGSLGKCSRMLKRLLTDEEVKQMMNAEITCKANQLPSELIYVNGEPLSEEELYILQTCLNPPRRLKPGRYWYDKVAGYWGKEMEKPSQIISPGLDVGGHIRRNASNGDTDILINNREITKVELLILQLAGVQCEGKPHFWVTAEGEYQEEGQNHIIGRLWDKKRARVACAILSLPVPSYSANSPRQEQNGYMSYYEQKTLNKLLLIGYKKSGSSTIYKQARLLYNVPFSEDERENIVLKIQTNLYSYLGMLLEARERFEEESLAEMRNNQSAEQSGHPGEIEQTDVKTIYSINARLKGFSDWFLKEKESGNLGMIFPAASREYAPVVADLWKDPAIQATYSRSELSHSAAYFLEQAMEVSRPDYEPSDTDILYAEGIASSVGLSCMEFSFPMSPHDSSLDLDYQHDPSMRYQLIRLHPRSLGENCKWLEMFEDVDVIMFCVSLTDYDEYFEDANGLRVNKIMASKQLFESIVTHPTLLEKRFLLILNKFDLLEEKIKRVPLTSCEWFEDFNAVISQNHNRRHNSSMAHSAFHYIAVKFRRLFDSLLHPFVDGTRSFRRKLFVSKVSGLDGATVDDALRYAREILVWQTEEHSFHEISTTSMDASSSS